MATTSLLRFGYTAGRTAVLAARAEIPIIIPRPVRGPAGQAVVTLLTPAGALLDGDAVQLDVDCGPETDVTLTTAAATKLNRCDTAFISFGMRVHVASNATFRYLPHELIPLSGTRYQQRLELDIDPGGRASLLELIAPGATATPFTYQSLQFATTVCVGENLAARERYVLTPQSVPQMGGYSHYGSMLLSGSWPAPIVSGSGASLLGYSQLPGPGFVVKMLGSSAQSVRATLLGVLPCAAWLEPLLPA